MPGLHIQHPDRSLTAAFGELVCVSGNVGCGKTTFLLQLAGLQSPPKGVRIRFDGEAGSIRMLFDRPRPIWLSETVGGELGFRRRWTDEADFRPLLARWGLAALDPERRLATLNRLQAVRLALAVMEWEGVRLALLDAPNDAFPSEDAAALAADVHAWIARSRGVAVVASNRREDWRPFAHRMWMMEDGRVREIH